MNGTNRSNIKPGITVDIVLKKDQPTGRLTRGVVQDILTSSSEHHRGIKVRLTDGQVGRVQHIIDGSGTSSKVQVPKPKTMRIDVWADVVCPFCYIGQHELQKALAQFEHAGAVKVVLHSYELNPSAPKDFSGNLHEYLAQHKGVSVNDAKAMNADVAQYASEVGLTFHLDNAKPANSFDAHRLIHLAKEYNLENVMMEKLHAAYFCEGKNIVDRQVLEELAVAAGLAYNAATKMFTASDFTDEVRADEKEAQKIGITGVPFFLFNSKFTITGSQRAESFAQALRHVWENE